MTKDGVTYTSNDVTVSAVNTATGEVTVPALTITPGGPTAPVSFEASRTTVLTNIDGINTGGANPGTVTSLAAITNARAGTFTILASDPGSWGRDIVVQITHEEGGRSEVDAHLADGNDTSTFRLKSTAGFYVDAWVELAIPEANASAASAHQWKCNYRLGSIDCSSGHSAGNRR